MFSPMLLYVIGMTGPSLIPDRCVVHNEKRRRTHQPIILQKLHRKIQIGIPAFGITLDAALS